MRVFYGFEGVHLPKGSVCTVGSYDGVHVGHRELISEVVKRSKEIGAESVLLTFEPHPRVVLGRAEGLKLLTTIDEKIELLRSAGVDNLIVIPFDRAFSQLKYSEFIERYLLRKVNMRCMVVGYNHLFGHKNEGDFHNLSTQSERLGFEVVKLPELRSEESKVSSTVIRKLIESGEVEGANTLLAREYLVINSKDPLKLLPPQGSYLGSVDGQMCEVEVSPLGEITTPFGGCCQRVMFHKKL